MKKYIFTEAQLKKIIDSEIDERSRSLANTRKKRLFPKSAMDANPDRFKEYDKEVNDINEGALSFGTNPNIYKLEPAGGFLKDNKGNTLCVQVSSMFTGTFPQGIDNMWNTKDGGAVIVPTKSKIGSITINAQEFKNMMQKLMSGGLVTIEKSGATIKIGRGLVNWCKSQWK
jgi:hypothetical protein